MREDGRVHAAALSLESEWVEHPTLANIQRLYRASLAKSKTFIDGSTLPGTAPSSVLRERYFCLSRHVLNTPVASRLRARTVRTGVAESCCYWPETQHHGIPYDANNGALFTFFPVEKLTIVLTPQDDHHVLHRESQNLYTQVGKITKFKTSVRPSP